MSPLGKHVLRVEQGLLVALLALVCVDGFLRGASPLPGLGLGFIAVLAGLGLWVTARQLEPPAVPHSGDVLAAIAGAGLACYLVRIEHLTGPLACVIVGTVAGLLPRLGRLHLDARAAAAYTGSFVGTTSPLVLPLFAQILIAAALAGIFMSTLRRSWTGVGGKLGLLGFAGVFLTTHAAHLLGNAGPGASPVSLGHEHIPVFCAVGALAAVVTGQLVSRGWSPVLASALPTLLFRLGLVAVGQGALEVPEPIAFAWIGGSFVGMTSRERQQGKRWFLPLAGLLFGILEFGFRPVLAGMGGTFGATAVVADLAVIGLLALWPPRRGKPRAFHQEE